MVSAIVQAGLDQDVVPIRWVAWLDIKEDPVRVTSGLYDLAFAGTGDVELDGFSFDAIDHQLIGVSEVQHNENGADTVRASLSGLIINDSELLAVIGDKANWQGRMARLWWYLVDETEARIGEIVPYYTGYMSDLAITGSRDSQMIIIEIESYLASLSEATGRTYLAQKEFDEADLSGDASVAVANGTSGAGLAGGGGPIDWWRAGMGLL